MKKEPKKWFCAKELNDALKINSAGASLCTMFKHGELKRRKTRISWWSIFEYQLK